MKQNNSSVFAGMGRCSIVVLLSACIITGCDSAASTTSKRDAPAEPKEAKPARKERKTGVLLVSHGSRSKSWRKMLSDIEQAVRDDLLGSGHVDGIRSAFMEYTEPSIAAQLKAFDEEGYDDVILVPLLLTVSSHSFDDIPTIIGQKQDHLTLATLKLEGIETYKPQARTTIAPLLDFPAILGKNVIRRARQMSKAPDKEGIILVAYGSEPYEEEWKQLLGEVAEEVRGATGVDCIECCWCGHIVRYKSKPTEETIKKVLQKKQRALVIPVLVAVDETFQGKIIGGAIKNVGENERIVYRHDAILPDDNINQWVIDISLELASKIADKDETLNNAP